MFFNKRFRVLAEVMLSDGRTGSVGFETTSRQDISKPKFTEMLENKIRVNAFVNERLSVARFYDIKVKRIG